jgi:hypothetical protein
MFARYLPALDDFFELKGLSGIESDQINAGRK